MDKTERIKMVKAMEFIARQINGEDVFVRWLLCGPGDGEIEYGDLDVRPEDEYELDLYLERDEDFADLMGVFLGCMARAHKSGGLWCDGVLDLHTQNAE